MILIKYATRGRPELFKRTINNIYNSIYTTDFKVLISADNDDPTMISKDMFDFNSRFHNNIICFGKSDSKIHAINRDMDNPIIKNWDILINMSDDMFFILNGWDKQLREDTEAVWGSSTDWFAHYSDGYLKAGGLPTMSIMGRDYYERDKYIYYPDYKSFSSDAEAMYVAMMRGRYYYFGDNKVLFKHMHPANDKSNKNDETYRINSLATAHDTELYWRRLHKHFDIPTDQRTCEPFKEHLNTNIHYRT